MKLTKIFDVNYYKSPHGGPKEWSHKYSETWDLTEWHCPKCGVKEVWEEQSGGDYYVGVQYICTACAFTFHMPSADEIKAHGHCNEPDVERLEKLGGNLSGHPTENT